MSCSPDGKRQVIPLIPPEGSKPGDRVVVKGYEHETHGGNARFIFRCPFLCQAAAILKTYLLELNYSQTLGGLFFSFVRTR